MANGRQMTSAERYTQEVLAAREHQSAVAADSNAGGISNGVPGWDYYVTFAGQTPERVRIDLRKTNWKLADEEHKDVRVLSATGAHESVVELWCKPQALVEMDRAEERANRPKPRRLSAPRFAA